MREMKDSGIDWIGAIPANWSVTKISGLYTLRTTKVNDRDYPPLSVTNKGIVPQLETAAKTNAHDDRKLVCKGDFAINSRSDRRGSCGISSYTGSVSLINTILRPMTEMNPQYYDWLFHTIQFGDEFYKWGHGIVDDLWTTGWQDMKKITIPTPPIEEQQAIANFLDYKCSEIDALISDIQQQIEILEQYKRSVITEAVTKGLDSRADMANCGVELIGIIPIHWRISKLKYIALSLTKGNGITKEDVVKDGDIPCVRYGEIYSKYDNYFTKCISSTSDEKVSIKQYFANGDILFTCTGELVEEIGKNIVYLGEGRCLAGGDIIIAKHTQNPSFLNYALNSVYSQSQKSFGKAKLKVVHISVFDIGNIIVALPPIEEQEEIARYLDSVCNETNSAIAAKKNQLRILEAYKKSLIFECVTGKKEVIV